MGQACRAASRCVAPAHTAALPQSTHSAPTLSVRPTHAVRAAHPRRGRRPPGSTAPQSPSSSAWQPAPVPTAAGQAGRVGAPRIGARRSPGTSQASRNASLPGQQSRAAGSAGSARACWKISLGLFSAGVPDSRTARRASLMSGVVALVRCAAPSCGAGHSRQDKEGRRGEWACRLAGGRCTCRRQGGVCKPAWRPFAGPAEAPGACLDVVALVADQDFEFLGQVLQRAGGPAVGHPQGSAARRGASGGAPARAGRQPGASRGAPARAGRQPGAGARAAAGWPARADSGRRARAPARAKLAAPRARTIFCTKL